MFYVSGLFGVAWCLAWFSLVTDEPRDHPLISRKELELILENRQVNCISHKFKLKKYSNFSSGLPRAQALPGRHRPRPQEEERQEPKPTLGRRGPDWEELPAPPPHREVTLHPGSDGLLLRQRLGAVHAAHGGAKLHQQRPKEGRRHGGIF